MTSPGRDQKTGNGIVETLLPAVAATGQRGSLAAGLADALDYRTSVQLADAIIESSDDAIVAKTLDGIVRTWNNGACAMFGYRPEDIIGRPILILIPPDRLEEEQLILSRVIRGERIEHFETIRIRQDGRPIHVSVTVSPIKNSDGVIIGASKIARDITLQKTGQRRLLMAANVFTYSSDAIALTDSGGRILETNEAFCSIAGVGHTESLGHPIESFIEVGDGIKDVMLSLAASHCDHLRIERIIRKGGGGTFTGRITTTAIRPSGGEIENFIILIADITESKEQQRQLEAAAYRDPLTGLPNRRSLMTRLHASIEQGSRDQPFALAFIDLDGFKHVNDTHGHETGDHFLSLISERLNRVLRDEDFIARIGGDEFVILLAHVGSSRQFEPIGERLLSACSDPVYLARVEATASCSIGVSFFRRPYKSAEAMLHAADTAMYEAKKAGKNRVRYAAQQSRSRRQTDTAPARSWLKDATLTCSLEEQEHGS